MEKDISNSAPKFFAVGAVGKGKSTFLNYIADGKDSQRFPSGSGFRSLTLNVTSFKGKIHATSTDIELYDAPGLMGSDLSLEVWKNIIAQSAVGKFNGILWVVSAKDRPSLTEVIIYKGLSYLFDNIRENDIVLVFTHCDLWDGKKGTNWEQLAAQWINELSKALQHDIRIPCTVFFGTKQTDSFKPNYINEMKTILSFFKDSHITHKQEIDYAAFYRDVLDAIDPRMKSDLMETLQKQVELIRKQMQEIRNQRVESSMLQEILKANQENYDALITAITERKGSEQPIIVGGGDNGDGLGAKDIMQAGMWAVEKVIETKACNIF